MKNKVEELCRLDGKVAIVTGGGSGIGKATAKVFADAGAKVVVTGRRNDLLRNVANEINGHAIACDVSNHAQVKHVFSESLKVFGKVDVLVNNAGGPGPIAQVADVDMNAWVECLNINLVGPCIAFKKPLKL